MASSADDELQAAMEDFEEQERQQQQKAAAAASGVSGGSSSGMMPPGMMGGGAMPPGMMMNKKMMQLPPGANPNNMARRVNINKKLYQVIYPQYIDSTLTPSEGRRVPASRGIPNPAVDEIIQALKECGFQEIIFDSGKSYPKAQSQPRQVPAPRGCIRLQIKEPASADSTEDEIRASKHPHLVNKRQVLLKVCDILKLRLRLTDSDADKAFAAEVQRGESMAANAVVTKGKLTAPHPSMVGKIILRPRLMTVPSPSGPITLKRPPLAPTGEEVAAAMQAQATPQPKVKGQK